MWKEKLLPDSNNYLQEISESVHRNLRLFLKNLGELLKKLGELFETLRVFYRDSPFCL